MKYALNTIHIISYCGFIFAIKPIENENSTLVKIIKNVIYNLYSYCHSEQK